MDDREAGSAADAEPAPDLSEVAAQCAAADLLDFAAQLAGLAEDLKALAARPIEPTPTLAEPDHPPEATSSDL
ncbi:hypothetical protein [Sinorhizobium meliloti]|uniref:Uncharacterized protein n=1 Tax=Rhizobium meliloti (strain 1021) TaxID=266834 RepID=Q92W23_RHIME|nr:hypothetical protein [Sinorhizobium meliloti]AGG71536.1 Hypothetical protein SM2011_b20545 [Sinorhizobium meliloti 2011]ASP62096.1 hypothetical protein CDO30_28210 [Sinorhizobium meliloti]MCK3804759.1 hypothetical protein [Sinorhizobium meliloti]MCK3810766.1 hypothetical protein [Sinorhizobium meliloti]MCK3815805.1 hypothetical protein [Sinorhizobium meliloti]